MSDVQAIRSWVCDPDGTMHPILTAQEARMLLDHLDNQRAARRLTAGEYSVFANAKQKLVFMEVQAEKRP